MLSLPDTLRPLKPRTISITEDQARLAIKYRLDADNFFFRIGQLNAVIAGKDSIIGMQKTYILSLETKTVQDAEVIAGLTRKLAKRSKELWIWRSGGIVFTGLLGHKITRKP